MINKILKKLLLIILLTIQIVMMVKSSIENWGHTGVGIGIIQKFNDLLNEKLNLC